MVETTSLHLTARTFAAESSKPFWSGVASGYYEANASRSRPELRRSKPFRPSADSRDVSGMLGHSYFLLGILSLFKGQVKQVSLTKCKPVQISQPWRLRLPPSAGRGLLLVGWSPAAVAQRGVREERAHVRSDSLLRGHPHVPVGQPDHLQDAQAEPLRAGGSPRL
jgi:hypothetical protein